MNKKTLIFLSFMACLLVSSMPILAQDHHHHHHHHNHEKKSDAHIAGHVLDAHTKEHLSFVNVQVEGTALGCLTDESGHFYLKNLPEGELTIVFSDDGIRDRETYCYPSPRYPCRNECGNCRDILYD